MKSKEEVFYVYYYALIYFTNPLIYFSLYENFFVIFTERKKKKNERNERKRKGRSDLGN